MGLVMFCYICRHYIYGRCYICGLFLVLVSWPKGIIFFCLLTINSGKRIIAKDIFCKCL